MSNNKEIIRVFAVDDEEIILNVYKNVIDKMSNDSKSNSELGNLEKELFGSNLNSEIIDDSTTV